MANRAAEPIAHHGQHLIVAQPKLLDVSERHSAPIYASCRPKFLVTVRCLYCRWSATGVLLALVFTCFFGIGAVVRADVKVVEPGKIVTEYALTSAYNYEYNDPSN